MRKLAEEIGAKFSSNEERSSGFLSPTENIQRAEVRANFKGWYIFLECLENRRDQIGPQVGPGGPSFYYRTRMSASYPSPNKLRFTIRRKYIWEILFKFLRLQGSDAPDFKIWSNDQYKARRLFTKLRLRQMIQSMPHSFTLRGVDGGIRGNGECPSSKKRTLRIKKYCPCSSCLLRRLIS